MDMVCVLCPSPLRMRRPFLAYTLRSSTDEATSSAGPFDLDTVIGPAALYAGESMLLFTFAAAVVEKAFDLGLVRRFGPAPAPEKSS
eukprot:scaffold4889_cov19-Tisochrysis_lutea.AAC.3